MPKYRDNSIDLGRKYELHNLPLWMATLINLLKRRHSSIELAETQ